MRDWNEVETYGLSLAETERSTSYGAPAVKVAGKAFVTRSRETDSFHVRSPHDEKLVLLESDPDTFWQTPHYEGWPGVLVRFASADPERVKLVIARAHWDRAMPAQRKRFGDRP